MSELLIPVRVDLGDSPNKLKIVEGSLRGMAKGADEFASSAKKASDNLKQGFTGDSTKTIKQQFREANIELQNLVAKFGALSPQAQAAAQRVAELRDVIEDSNRAAQAADLDDRFRTIGTAVAGVASAFQGALAIQGLFGDKSAETEEALKKVQAAFALTQGITGVFEGIKAFKTLGAEIKNSTALAKVYSVSQAAAAVVTRAFGGAVVTTSLAFKGLAVAIAATGIGLLVVALGILIPKLIDFFSTTEDATAASNRLKSAEEGLADELKATNDQIERRNQGFEFANELALLNAKAAGKSVEQIRKIEKEGRDRAFNEAINDLVKAESKRKKVLEKAENDLATVKKRGSKKQIEDAEAAFKKIEEEQIANYNKLRDDAIKIEQGRQLAVGKILVEDAEDRKKKGEEAVQQAKQNAEKRARAVEQAQRLQSDLEISLLGETQQKLANIEREYADKRKTLREGGKTDFSALEQARAKEIQGVVDQANADALQARRNFNKAFENVFLEGIKRSVALQQAAAKQVQETNNLVFRAQISGIRDEYTKRNLELKKAEDDEINTLKQSYKIKETNLTQYFIKLAAIRAFYRNEGKKNLTDQQKEEEELIKQQTSIIESAVEEGLSGLGESIGQAISSGANVFEAVGKSLIGSLGGLLIQLGKLIITSNIKIEAAKKLFGTGPLAIAAGVALVAFGALLKAQINKKSQQGFATGGYVSGPGTETSDSIPANLSRGEYVIKAKSVRKYGKDVFEKLNRGAIPVQEAKLPDQTNLARLAGLQNALKQFSRSGGSAKALVNSTGGLIKSKADKVPAFVSKGEFVIDRDSVLKYGVRTFDALNKGTYPEELLGTQKTTTRNSGSSKALVNRFDNNLSDVLSALKFSNGGLVGFADGGFVQANTTSFTRNSGSSKALVNRFDVPQIPNVTVNETFQREVPYIATTRISGQDLKLVLERADRRFANAT